MDQQVHCLSCLRSSLSFKTAWHFTYACVAPRAKPATAAMVIALTVPFDTLFHYPVRPATGSVGSQGALWFG
eukprot:1139858-Pelagomonas_calceolata.AAC.8